MEDDIRCIIKSGMLLAIAIVAQLIGKNIPQISQIFVGPVINLILILATFICGIWYGCAIGILTPLTAWILGQLPTPLGPFIPFIMVGNCIFILAFGLLRKYRVYGRYLGVILGAFLKYIFLYLSAVKLIFLFKINFPAPVTKMLAAAMGMPQLVTALTGGIAALLFLEVLKKRNIRLER